MTMRQKSARYRQNCQIFPFPSGKCGLNHGPVLPFSSHDRRGVPPPSPTDDPSVTMREGSCAAWKR